MASLKAAVTARPEGGEGKASLTLQPSTELALRKLFVTALVEESAPAWEALLHALANLPPTECSSLAARPDILHYVGRTLRLRPGPVAQGSVVQLLLSMLSGEEVEKLSFSTTLSSPAASAPRAGGRRKGKRRRERGLSLDSSLAHLFTYSPEKVAVTFRGQSLQLQELTNAVAVVADELTLLKRAAPHLPPGHSALHSSVSLPPSERLKPSLSPVYRHELPAERRQRHSTSPSYTSHRLHAKRKPREKPSSGPELHTAYDVIAAFASGSLQAGAESVYLNPVPCSPWNPYNLSVVSKTRADPEHYVISKFGVLHVHPNGTSDLQSFAEWLREAGLFSLCRQVPFFHHYLLRKAVQSWHKNVRYSHYLRLLNQVSRMGLQFFPKFREGLQQVWDLCCELQAMPTHTLAPLGRYSAEMFEQSTAATASRLQRLLQRYLKYCQRVVTGVIQETQSLAQQLELEKKHQPFVSDLPISIQTEQHAALERRLGEARYRAGRLGEYVVLVEQMMAACLLQVARQAAQHWVVVTLGLREDKESTVSTESLSGDNEMGSPTADEDESGAHSTEGSKVQETALLMTELTVKDGMLQLQPSTEELVSLLTSPLLNITTIIINTARPLTAHSHSQGRGDRKGGGDGRGGGGGRADTNERVKSLLQSLKGLPGDSRARAVVGSSHARQRLSAVVEESRGGSAGGYSVSTGSVLQAERMKQLLEEDPELQSLQSRLQFAVEGVRREVGEACSGCSWLGQLHSHIQHWSRQREKVENMVADKLDDALSELNQSLSSLSSLPPLLPSSHSLFLISTGSVASSILPQVHQLQEELLSSAMAQCRKEASRLVGQAQKSTQSLSADQRRIYLEGFVEYAGQLKECKTFYTQHLPRVDWVNNIHNILSKYGVQLEEEDRMKINQLQRKWAEFELCLQSAEQFVQTNTPIKAEGLQKNISSLEERLAQLAGEANTGQYVDPEATPSSLLEGLEAIHKDMSEVRSQITGCSRWKEAITNQHHDISTVLHYFELFYARQELWKYRRLFDSYDKDWRQKPFQKLDMTYVSQKVCSWQEVYKRLSRTLAPEDPVLRDFREKVEDISIGLPLLLLLSSKDLYTNHWNSIFAAFDDEVYDPTCHYTMRDLLLRGLEKHADLITEICHEASQQSRLREEIIDMERQWQEMHIELLQAKQNYYSFATIQKDKPRTKTISFGFTEASGKPGSHRQPEQTQQHLFTVMNGQRLVGEVSHAILRLQQLHRSPHLGKLKGRVESLRSSLSQLSELLAVIMDCQDQWKDLLELFLHLSPSTHSQFGLEGLQEATSLFQEVTQSIHTDPRVLSLLGKHRGQKGHRQMQGDFLRQTLHRMLAKMDHVLLNLEGMVQEAVSQTPRLGYLSQREAVKTMAYKGDLMTVLHLINKMFPSITTLRFVETSNERTTDYQVTGVEGYRGERLALVVPLVLAREPASHWVRALEAAIQFSLASRLTDCLDSLPACLLGRPMLSAPQTPLQEWLRGQVLQIVLLTLDIKWSAELKLAGSTGGDSLKHACSRICAAIDTAVQVLLRQVSREQKGMERKEEKEDDLMVHKLQSIIICLRHKSDFASCLLAGQGSEEVWSTHIHYTAITPPSMELQDEEKEGVEVRSSSLLGSSARSRQKSISSRHSLTSSRHSLTASYSSLSASRPPISPLSVSGGRQLPSPSSPFSSRILSRVSLNTSMADLLQIAEPTGCLVHCAGWTGPYGFEYCSPTPPEPLTPTMEASLVTMAAALGSRCFLGLTADHTHISNNASQLLAKVLGRHYYKFTCSPLTSSSSLLLLLSTAIQAGSILCLEGTHSLSSLPLLTLRHHLISLQAVLTDAFQNQSIPATAEPSESTISRPTSTPHSSHPPHTPLLPSRISSSKLNWYQPPSYPSLSTHNKDIQFMGRKFSASPLFSCCVLLDSSLPTDTSCAVGSASSTSCDALRDTLRLVQVFPPDHQLLVEGLLQSCGFTDCHSLSHKLTSALTHLESLLAWSQPCPTLSLPRLRRILSSASLLLSSSSSPLPTSATPQALLEAVQTVYGPQLQPNQTASLVDILQSYFLGSQCRPSVWKEETGDVMSAVEQEMKERHLQTTTEILEKIQQLHQSLQSYACTVCLGVRGTGFTTSLHTLATALHHTGRPSVDITTINPAAYSWEELFGGYQNVTGMSQWIPGILSRLLSTISSSEHHHQVHNHPDKTDPPPPHPLTPHWVVLDGPLSLPLLDSLSALLSGEGLVVGPQERLFLPSSCQLLLRPAGTVCPLHPAMLRHCCLLYWPADLVTPELMVEAWLSRAPTLHDLSSMSVSYLGSALQTLLPESLAYLQRVQAQHCGSLYTAHTHQRVPGLAETQCLLNLLSALLERNCPTRESNSMAGTYTASRASSRLSGSSSVLSSASHSRISSAASTCSSHVSLIDVQLDSDIALLSDHFSPDRAGFSPLEAGANLAQLQILSILSFSFIWSIGAFVPFSEVTSFDEFAREQILDLPFFVHIPEEGSVFDYRLDLKTYHFQPWVPHKTSKGAGCVATAELSRVSHIADLYLSYDLNVLLVGEPGSGKTTFVKHLLQTRLAPLHLPITHSLQAPQLRHILIEKVTEVNKKASGRWRAQKSNSDHCLLFLDDIHLGSRDSALRVLPTDCPAPPVIETVLSASRHRCLHDYPRSRLYYTDNVHFIGSCCPSQHSTVLSHLLPTFNPVPLFPPSDNSLHLIFSSKLLHWLKQRPQTGLHDLQGLPQAVSAASVTVFRSVSQRLCPSPSSAHYHLSLSHLMALFEGLQLLPLEDSLQFSLLTHRSYQATSYRDKLSQRGQSRGRGSTLVGGKASTEGQRGRLTSHRRWDASMHSRARHPPSQGKGAGLDGAAEASLPRLLRLWCHESTRVYADRMADGRHRAWFVRLLETCVKYCFCGVEFDRPSGVSTTEPGTAMQGGRRARAGRGRSHLPGQGKGLSYSELMSAGVCVDILRTLLGGEEGRAPGQLLALEQVFIRGEDITDLIFCQLPAMQTAATIHHAKGQEENKEEEEDAPGSKVEAQLLKKSTYSELGDGQVMETLGQHLQRYITQTTTADGGSSGLSAAPQLVLFRRAMEHVTRLCRALVLPGGHLLMLGQRGSGRRSLSRFVAHMMGGQLFEMCEGDSVEHTRDQLKQALMTAGIDQRCTVLLVSCGGQCSNLPFWDSLCEIISEGLPQGLFTNSDLLMMSNKLAKGHLKRTVELASRALSKASRKYLHVLVVWDQDSSLSPFHADSLEEGTRNVFVQLCGSCTTVDQFQPLQQQDLADIALRWWQDRAGQDWHSLTSSGSQLEALASLMAHVHLTTLATLDQSQPLLSLNLLSLSTYTECLRLTESIASRRRAVEEERDNRLQGAIQRVLGVEVAVQEMEEEGEGLQGQRMAVEEALEEQAAVSEACQEKYKAASQRCKVAKETIDRETDAVQQLQQAVQDGLGQVAPLYCSALEALNSVSKTDVLEIMSYREPPNALVPVFNALCMLFDRPQKWEECKRLLLSPHFFQSLQFYDKDHLSSPKLHQLQQMLRPRAWRVDSFEHGSHAAVSLCTWVSALLDYHRARAVVRPLQARLVTAEKVLKKAEKTFVAMQKDMLEAKTEFKAAQRKRNNSLQQKNDIEKKIKAVYQRLQEANLLLQRMATWRKRWQEEREAIQSRADSAASHALLTAATVCYLSRVPANQHQALQANWRGYCAGLVPLGCLSPDTSSQHYGSHKPILPVQEQFSVPEVLSSWSERSSWVQQTTFPCGVTMERALSARACLQHSLSQWPLVLDPLQLFQGYAEALTTHPSRDSPEQGSPSQSTSQGVTLVRVSEAGWLQVLMDCAQCGGVVMLILDHQPDSWFRKDLLALLHRDRLGDPQTSDLEITVAPEFQLYLVLEESVRGTRSGVLGQLGLALDGLCVVDMSLCPATLETHLLQHTLGLERPQNMVRHRSLLADLALHERQLKTSQEQVLETTLEQASLLSAPDILQTLSASEQEERLARNNMRDSQAALDTSAKLFQVYQPFACSATASFLATQQLTRALHYPSLALASFKALITTLIRDQQVTPPPAKSMEACRAHLLLLQQELLSCLLQQLRSSLLPQHHLLLPLLISLGQLRAEGVVREEEVQLLKNDSRLLLVQLGEEEEGKRKPSWIAQQCWSDLHQLQHSSTMQGLITAVAGSGEEWREYADLEPSLLSPAPHTGGPINSFHKMLLWRALRPSKFYTVVNQFITQSVGPEFTSYQTSSELDLAVSRTLAYLPIACPVQGDTQWRAANLLQILADSRSVSLLTVDILNSTGFSQVDGSSCNEVLSQLDVWGQQRQWVLLDHVYLLDNTTQFLHSLANSLHELQDDLSSDFRLWVTLPSHQTLPAGWPSIVLHDNHTTHHYNSQQLLADLRLALKSEVSDPLTDRGSLLALSEQLQQLLPRPLPETPPISPSPSPPDTPEVTGSQRVQQFFLEEWKLLSETLASLHGSLQWAREGSSSSLHFSSSALLLLQEVARNKVPSLWRHLLPLNLSLSSLLPSLSLLREGVELAREGLRRAGLPAKLHPLWVTQPRRLLLLLRQNFAEQHNVPVDTVTLHGEVQSDHSADTAHTNNDYSITLIGLRLCGADWNPLTSTLTPPTITSSPPLTITVLPTLTPHRHLYHCPVYSSDSRHQHHLLFHLPLPATSDLLVIPQPSTSLHCVQENYH